MSTTTGPVKHWVESQVENQIEPRQEPLKTLPSVSLEPSHLSTHVRPRRRVGSYTGVIKDGKHISRRHGMPLALPRCHRAKVIPVSRVPVAVWPRGTIWRPVGHVRSEATVACVESPVLPSGPSPYQQDHAQGVGPGRVRGLAPAPPQDPVTRRGPGRRVGGLVHVDSVILQVAVLVGGQVLEVQVDLLAGGGPDAPVAPQGWVGANVVGRKEVAVVATQTLVAASQGKESPAPFNRRTSGSATQTHRRFRFLCSDEDPT